MEPELGEECDDGEVRAGDGCSADCKVEAGWECPGNLCSKLCGNGQVDMGEGCDDMNNKFNDGCS